VLVGAGEAVGVGPGSSRGIEVLVGAGETHGVGSGPSRVESGPSKVGSGPSRAMGVLVGAGEVDRVGSGSPGVNEQAVMRLRDSNSPNLPVRPVIFAINLTSICMQ
jgi:hypothetical protein